MQKHKARINLALERKLIDELDKAVLSFKPKTTRTAIIEMAIQEWLEKHYMFFAARGNYDDKN